MLLYALLYLTGYPGITLDDIKHFRQLGSPAAGHPEYGHAPGIETTTGPLGQGIANAVGHGAGRTRCSTPASAMRWSIISTYVIASDGDLMEGISHEACALAGHLKLNRLIVLLDDNDISIDGPTSLAESADLAKRFEADGLGGDAHRRPMTPRSISALEQAQTSDRPVLIACRTIIGYGAPKRAGTAKGAWRSARAPKRSPARATSWAGPMRPFEMPDDLLEQWRAIGAARQRRAQGLGRAPGRQSNCAKPFDAALIGEIPASLGPALAALKAKFSAEKPGDRAPARRRKSALDVINAELPTTIGGSADLTGPSSPRPRTIEP